MFFHIDFNSGEPIGRQIASQVKLMAVSGELAPGERLPSIRELAADLKINPTTAARVYKELAHAGVVTLRPGQGVFVSEASAADRLASGEVRRIVQDHARTLLVEGLRLGLDFEAISGIVREEYDTIRGGNK